MPDEIDVHAMLVRAETRAHRRLEEMRAVYRVKSTVLSELEEEYARAIAVRKNWEAFELRVSKENQSSSSFDADPKCKLCGTRRSVCQYPNAPASRCCHRCSHE